jgi:hypothetical protein
MLTERDKINSDVFSKFGCHFNHGEYINNIAFAGI